MSDETTSAFARLMPALTQPQWRAVLMKKMSDRGAAVGSWVSELNPMRIMTEEISLAFEQFELRGQKLAGGLLLGTSIGDFLTALARSFYDEDRESAAATAGFVQLKNDTTGPYTREADEILVGTAGSSASSKNYRNVSRVDLPAGKTTQVLVRAVATGTSYNVPANSITDVKRPLPGVTVSNPPVMGSTWIQSPGLDPEPDGMLTPPQGLKGRCRTKWHTVGLGTADAYRYFATSPAPGQTVSPVTRAEPLSDYSPVTGTFEPNAVTLFLASPAGPVAPPIVAQVESKFDVPRRYPLATRLYVRSAEPVLADLAGTLTYDLRYDPADVASRVAEALALYQGTFRIGGTLYAAETIRVVMGSFDEATIDLTLDSMAPLLVGVGKIPVLVNKLRLVGKPMA